MNHSDAESIIETFKEYSAEAKNVLGYLQRYDYRQEAADWDNQQDPTLVEAEHPKLHDIYIRLARYLGPIPYRTDNLDRAAMLRVENLDSFKNYLEVSQETLLAAKFNRIPIEPMQDVANAFEDLGLLTEAARLRGIHDYALGFRRWYRQSKHNPGTPITINIEVNYDQAPPEVLESDSNYRTFASLFSSTCNYSTKQKRALFNGLKELYATSDPAVADKVVMAVILLFRKPRTTYKRPFGDVGISDCKSKAMSAFGRDTTVIKSYTENSLTKPPKIAQVHITQATSIIAKALETFR